MGWRSWINFKEGIRLIKLIPCWFLASYLEKCLNSKTSTKLFSWVPLALELLQNCLIDTNQEKPKGTLRLYLVTWLIKNKILGSTYYFARNLKLKRLLIGGCCNNNSPMANLVLK
jgi:hypothetical protein